MITLFLGLAGLTSISAQRSFPERILGDFLNRPTASGSFYQERVSEGEIETFSCGRSGAQIGDCHWEQQTHTGWTNKKQEWNRKIVKTNEWCNLTLTAVNNEDFGSWRCILENLNSPQVQEGYFTLTSTQEDLIDIRLPTSVKPEEYTVVLYPHLDPEDFSVEGRVIIQVEVLEPTENLTLHIWDLKILENLTEVVSEDADDSYQIAGHGYDEDRQFYIVKMEEQLEAGIYLLKIDFIGYLNNELSGFYRSSYLDSEGNRRWLATTQFETTSARRAFPCFDEPAMKATFQINMIRKSDMTSISNMPKESEYEVDSGLIMDKFENSLKMSTYLVAFVVSDFVYRESVDEGNGIQFRIWSRADLYDQTAYAAKVGPKILKYYEEYFNIKFPLPKQDMIAIPDFGAGAMENWGLVTYREAALLYQEGVSSLSEREYVAAVIAHELAHQWFGDLVTMEWWTDLWLNEGFASYTEYIGTEFVAPETSILDRIILQSVQPALALDALESSHPISITVNNPDEINEIFDGISYAKGASVIRMMANFMEISTFNKGITEYLSNNAYGNANQDTLWSYLTVAGHVDGTLDDSLTIKDIMDTWTLQMGYPVVTVTRQYDDNVINFQQSRFLINPNSTSADEYTWYVPVSYAIPLTTATFNNTTPKLWIYPNSGEAEVVENEALANLPVVANVQQSGFYRVNYDQQNWNLIAETLVADHNLIHTMNRAQLLDDSFNLARAGLLDYTLALAQTQYLSTEFDYIPWSSAFSGFSYLESMLKRSPGYGGFKQYMINALQPLYNQLGFTEKPDDAILDGKLREKVVSWMCKLGQEECVQNSLNIFNTWMMAEDPDLESPVPAFSRVTVLCTAMKKSSEKEWNFLFERFRNSNNANEKNTFLSALGCINEDWILERYLAMALDETSGVKRQDGYRVVVSVSDNTLGRYIAWNWIRNNWNMIRELYDTGVISFTSRMIEAATRDFNTESDLKELDQFIVDHEGNLGTANMAAKQMVESTRVNMQWMENHYDTIVEWLTSK